MGMASEAQNLVERARLGDQNAMAMIAVVNKRALDGVTRAKLAKGMIQKYIEDHPTSGTDSFGAEKDKAVSPALLKKMHNPETMLPAICEACKYRDGFLAASLVLSYIGPITRNKVKDIGLSSFGSDQKTYSFYWGVTYPDPEHYFAVAGKVPPDALDCTRIGQVFGRARKLQNVRAKGSCISNFSPMAGWELGE
jgi:hypothetical protein